jgi:hypothetical protein
MTSPPLLIALALSAFFSPALKTRTPQNREVS